MIELKLMEADDGLDVEIIHTKSSPYEQGLMLMIDALLSAVSNNEEMEPFIAALRSASDVTDSTVMH